jgi:hypothetical protein
VTDQPTTDDRVCHIRSTTDGQGRAACLMTWGPITVRLDPTVVLATGRDLMAAAAAAETDVALVDVFTREYRARGEVIGHMLQAVRRQRTQPAGRVALRIAAVAGVRTGLPLVHIARGSQKGELSPDEARDMALAWISTAAAAQIDVRLRYALGEWDHLTAPEIERLFTLIQQAAR